MNTIRTHRFLVPTLLVLATIIGFAGAFAVWVNRQALNTDHWATTSGKLLADEKVRTALSTYMVNELFSNVDVATELKTVLPPRAQVLAAPAAAGLQQLAEQRAPKFLARPKVQDAWIAANRAAHRQLLRVIDGGGSVVSNSDGNVTLNLRTLITQLATSLGVQSQVAAAQSKLQGSGGAQALAQQKLGITLPASTGQLVIMRSDDLETAQDIGGAVKGLAIVLPAIAIALFALAIYLARGRRRRTLRTTGWCFFAIGVLLLLIRRVAGNQIVDGLVKVPSNKPAIHDVWSIATSLLYALAVAMIVYGLVIVASAWLAGNTRPARFLRESLAPSLRDNPATAYGVVGGALLLVVAWGPTPAFRNVVTILLFAGLLAFGVTMLRRETALEFPDAQHGDALNRLRERRAAAKARRTAAAPAPTNGIGTRLNELERLVALHDRGDLTDTEFAAEKAHLAGTTN
jgi:cytochrome b561